MSAESSPPQSADEHELVLVKQGQRYVFRCPHGQEYDLFKRLADQVRDPDVDLNWFDAAVLSHQMGQKIKERLASKAS